MRLAATLGMRITREARAGFAESMIMSAQHRYEFRSVVAGVETLPCGASMPRHHHNEGYATILLAGSVTEVSFAGRMYAEAGQVRSSPAQSVSATLQE
jgi:hypothetical protein